jgi:DNA replication protein DnaC
MEQLTEALPDRLKELIKQHRESLQTTTEFKQVKEFVFSLGLDIPDEIIIDNYISFLTTYQISESCKQCNNRETCDNKDPGYSARIQGGYDGYKVIYFQCDKDRQYKEKQKISRLLESSRIPELFKTRTFETFKINDSNKPPFDIAKKFCDENEDEGIVFSGPPGVGKTHLAAAIMNYKLNQGIECIFCTVPELLSDIRRVIKSEQETSELMELVKNTEFLILDDLGAEKETEWVAEKLFVILNARLVRKKSTVITTNFQKPSELIEKLCGGITGQRIVSRIREMCQWVNMSGSDYRLK